MNKFPAPPIQTAFTEKQDIPISRPWTSWFQSLTNALNTPPVTVTGSRASGAALESLLTQLAAQGIIKDDSTA
jgi:hypothetical protein